jgi:hypothetical protein
MNDNQNNMIYGQVSQVLIEPDAIIKGQVGG